MNGDSEMEMGATRREERKAADKARQQAQVNAIRVGLIKNGMQQKDLADLVDMKTNHLSQAMNLRRKFSYDELTAIKRVLSIDMEEEEAPQISVMDRPELRVRRNFAARLKRCRLEMDLSYEDVTTINQIQWISISDYVQIEEAQREPTLAELEGICRALTLSPTYLVLGINQREDRKTPQRIDF